MSSCREFIFVQSQRISLRNLERSRIYAHLTALGGNFTPPHTFSVWGLIHSCTDFHRLGLHHIELARVRVPAYSYVFVFRRFRRLRQWHVPASGAGRQSPEPLQVSRARCAVASRQSVMALCRAGRSVACSLSAPIPTRVPSSLPLPRSDPWRHRYWYCCVFLHLKTSHGGVKPANSIIACHCDTHQSSMSPSDSDRRVNTKTEAITFSMSLEIN